jgi:hypothetical protein
MRTADLVGLAVLVVVVSIGVMLRTWRRPEHEARSALSERPPTSAGRMGAGPSGARFSGATSPGAGPAGAVPARARAPTSEDVAATMVLLAVALQSGCGVIEAIEQVADVAPSVPAAELSVVAAALRWGLSEERAWAEVDPRWSRAAMALRLAGEAGVAPSALLMSGAEDLRAARLATIDVAAAKLGVRLVVPLGVAFLPAFVLTTVVPVVLALAHHLLAS